MDPESLWNELSTAALLGTERKAFAPSSASGGFAALAGGLVAREPERGLLGTAAALSLYRRAGRTPVVDPAPPPEPAGAEARPRCSTTSVAHLAMMLSGMHQAALPEWLAALERRGARAPEEAIPGLLDIGRREPEHRPVILAAVGERGRWLAGLNPDWDFVSEPDVSADTSASERFWETGTLEQRLSLARQLRATDPARARTLVASSWKQDPPEDRAKFLKAFENGLSLEDEPFLEEALDDRRKEVRTEAAERLQQLAGSRLCRRMVERAAPLLGLPERAVKAIVEGLAAADPGGAAKDFAPVSTAPFKEVELPQVCDKAMVRDGIEPKSGQSGLGERAWWLSQMVGCIPPSAWSLAWGRGPEEVVKGAIKGKWSDMLYPALVAAARRHRDAGWIETLLPHRKLAGHTVDLDALFEALPPERRERAALGLFLVDDGEVRVRFKLEPLGYDHMQLLELVPAPWGDELAEVVLARLPLNLREARYLGDALSHFLKAAGRCLPATAAAEAAAQWTVDDAMFASDRRQFDEFLALLQFRHDMLKELSA
jgi:hypothetical protein